ncbi:MAG: pyruvate, phosphate dikinase, partial [Planctomycetes bacterium]|nr:pyruvate, phosphate dikinase [Planctomycetota bacterium]
GEITVDYKTRQFSVGDQTVKEGDWISIDGTTGEVIRGRLETKPSEVLQVLLEKTLKPEQSESYHVFERIMTWADEYRRLRIRTNADQPDQAATAISFGAEGIGLCRTEHMFFEGVRIDAVREMIVATDREGREKALAKLLPMQRADFVGIFKEMKERPVTVRTLDPPLHEFLPHTDKELQDLADKLGISYAKLKS